MFIRYHLRVKLSGWARRNGIHYQTAWEWARAGKMPVPVTKTPSGSWLVDEPALDRNGRAVVYCRVSSAEQKADLDRQVARVVAEANRRGIAISDTITETGSGLNGCRRELHRILADPKVTTIVVEHRERLARFGVEHLESALSATGRSLVVLDESETTHDVVRDITEVLTSMCARLYGRRSAVDRARRAVAVATGEASE